MEMETVMDDISRPLRSGAVVRLDVVVVVVDVEMMMAGIRTVRKRRSRREG